MKYSWNVPRAPLFVESLGKALISKQVKSTLNDMTSIVKANVQFEAPVGASAMLRNKIGTAITGLIGKVFTGVSYAIVIEKGRRAAPVSRDANLEVWIRRSRKGLLRKLARFMALWLIASAWQE